MRAWQINDTGGIDSYELVEVPEPEPGPGQVRIDLRISALNHLDLWVAQGLPAPKHFPHTGGGDGAGAVDAVGEGVAGFEIGDEVIIDPSMSCGECRHCRNDDIVYCDSFAILGEHVSGTFCDRIVVPAINAVRKPKAMSWEVAGSFGLTTATALRMLERAGLGSGQRLLVVGVGSGVSTSALILGLALGAEVYVTSRSPEKIARAVAMGAADGFDSGGDFGKEMTAVGGADVVIENVGPATMRQSMRAARPGGKIAICGSTSGPKMELTLPHLFFRQLELIGSSMANHGQFARATTWVSQSEVAFPVSRVFDFDELPDALRYLESGVQLGKVALSHVS
jgi:NADPH:quinone reductase-like Zn-dependent oxidoreductase